MKKLNLKETEFCKKELKKIIESNLKLKYNQKSSGGRLKPDLRFDISGKSENTIKILQDILNLNKLKNLKIVVINPNDGDDAKSGTYFTYLIKGKNINISIVDSMKNDSRIGRKEFAPNKFLKTEYEYTSKELYNEVKSKFFSMKKLPNEMRDYMIYLMDQIKNSNIPENVSGSGNFVVKKEKHTFKVTSSEEANIFNDFGEVLSAYYLGRLTKESILFPAGSNNPIADFYIGETPISAKNKAGAKAAITGILSDETLYNELIKELGDKAQILKIIKESTVLHSFLKIAEFYDVTSWKALIKRVGRFELLEESKSLQRKQDLIIKDKMYNWLDNIYSLSKDGIYCGDKQELFSAIREYTNEVGIGKTMALENKYRPNSNKRYGVFIYPLYSEITKRLQADSELVEKITNVINKMPAKQIHIYNKTNVIEFKLDAFKDVKFKFDTGNISAWNPTNSNITFKVS